MHKVVTMQDISCVGKCSLTAALPVISAMGIETAVLPTAVLSTHTMFNGFTFLDLTDQLRSIMSHWKVEGFAFDAIYTGYLGSVEQIDIASELFDTFGNGKLKIVDPCMADDGKLYAGFTETFAKEMTRLCTKADIICPNLSEACFLLDIPYQAEYDMQYIQRILQELADKTCDTVILTGTSFCEGKTGVSMYTKSTGTFDTYETDRLPQQFHGTGDLWASALCGAMVSGKNIHDACAIACEFVRESIRLTLAEKDHNIYGVNFEQAIPYLIQLLYNC